MQKHMVLSDGVARVEAPPLFGGCGGCDLLRTALCRDEVREASIEAFGGSCFKRNVIYIKADPQPVKVEGGQMTEAVSIEFKRYKTPQGQPTCRTRDCACAFLGSSTFGTRDMCMFDASSYIYRDPDTQFTVPCKSCPIWGDNKGPY